MSLLKTIRKRYKADLVAARVSRLGNGLGSIRKEYKSNLMAGRIKRLGYGLGWLTVLILWIIGCGAAYPSGGPQSRFWSQVRPANLDTERLVHNARYLKAAGRTQLALRELEQAHQRDPENLVIVNLLAQCYEDLGEWRRAEELYLEGLSHSQNPALANNLCFSYYLAGNYEKAATGFRKLLEQHPQSATIRNNLGLTLIRMGHQDEAYALWQKAEGEAVAQQRLYQALTALGLPGSGLAGEQRVAKKSGPATSPEAIQKAADKTAFAHVQEYPATASSEPAAVVQGSREKPAEQDHSQKPVSEASSHGRSGLPDHNPTPPLASHDGQPARLPVLRACELLFTKIEILNGNGVNNMARQNRSWLHLEGFDTVAIGNYKTFAQDQTLIFYRPQAARVAKVLGAKFFRTDNLRVDPELSGDLEVRVVLGRDVLQKEDVLAKLAD